MRIRLLNICIAACIYFLLTSPSRAYNKDQIREQIKYPALYFSFSIDQPDSEWMKQSPDSPVFLNGSVRTTVIEAVKLHPRDVDSLWEALSPEEQGKFTDYEQKLTAILDSAGQDAWRVHEALGLILYIRGDKENALEHFRTAVDMNLSADAAYNALLVDLREKGKLAEAAMLMEQRVRSWKSAAERLRLSRVYAELGRLDLAEKHCRVALHLDSSDADTACMMGVLILKRYGDPKEAAHYLQKAIGSNDDVDDRYFALGVAYLLMDDREQAIKTLEKSDTPEAEKLLNELTNGQSRSMTPSKTKTSPVLAGTNA